MKHYLPYLILFIFISFTLFGILSLSSLHSADNGFCAVPALGLNECPASMSQASLVFHHLDGFQSISLTALMSLFLTGIIILFKKLFSVVPQIKRFQKNAQENYENVRYFARRLTLKLISYNHRRDPENGFGRASLV
jgi:hypothetical protein